MYYINMHSRLGLNLKRGTDGLNSQKSSCLNLPGAHVTANTAPFCVSSIWLVGRLIGWLGGFAHVSINFVLQQGPVSPRLASNCTGLCTKSRLVLNSPPSSEVLDCKYALSCKLYVVLPSNPELCSWWTKHSTT